MVLEIASGSGEHVVHFAAAFSQLRWQPSDSDPDALVSIAAWSAEAGPANVAPPLSLDAAAADWPLDRADAVLCINMVHNSPWAAALGLLTGSAALRGSDAPLILYGPYLYPEVPTAPTTPDFDPQLRHRNPHQAPADHE